MIDSCIAQAMFMWPPITLCQELPADFKQKLLNF